jgi:gluconate 2-dehydrogenase gamma chain
MLGDVTMHDPLKIDRRSLMQTVALLIGAATVPTLAGCKAIMDGDGGLDAGRLKLLGAIADTIIPVTDTPGAVAAGVPKLLAGMLRDWASAERRTELTGAIDEIGRLDPKGFAELDPAKRNALLAEHDKAAVQPGPPPKVKLSGIAAMMAGPPMANPAYVRLKGLIINLYYASEIASTKELIFEAVPGKYVASLDVTPQTRPFAGVGGLF